MTFPLVPEPEALAEARLSGIPRQLMAGGMGLYLLVDPMLGDPVLCEPADQGLTLEALNALRATAWDRPTHALSLPAALALDAAQAPYLVELQGANDPWFATSVHWAVEEAVQSWLAEPDQATPHRVGGWLQSAAFGPELADALTGCLRLSTQAHTTARYLRLADRRVLSLAVHVLGESSVARRLPPVQHWHWLDAHAAWRSVSARPGHTPEDDHATPPKTPSRQPLATFTSAQWSQMTQGEAVHTHMTRLIRQRLTHHETPPPAEWSPVSTAQWQAALTGVMSPS